MHLIWHIFKKDARLMRGPLAAWVGLQLITFAIAGAISFPLGADAEPGWMDWVGGAHILFVAITWMSAYFFVAIPLQEDGVSGEEAFWLTRPVARWELLGAKLLDLIVFFALLPVLLRLPWWLGHGFSLHETGLAALETIETSGAIAGLALALACVTSGGQFYRWTLAVVVMVVGGGFLLLAFLPYHGPSTPGFLHAYYWTGVGVMIATPLALVAVSQFLAPDRLRSCVLIAVFLLAGIFQVTMIPFVPRVPLWPADFSAALTKIALPAGKVRVTPGPTASGTFLTLKKGTLLFGDTRTGTVYGESDFTVLATAASSLAQSGRLPPSDGSYDFYTSRRDGVFEIDAATLEAEGTFWAMEYQLSLPLVDSAEVKAGSRLLRVSQLSPGRPGGRNAVEIRGQLVLQETLPALAAEEGSRLEGLSEFYFLVTPSGAKRIMPDSTSAFVSSEVAVRTSFFPFGEEATAFALKSGAAPESVRLVKVGLRRLGNFQGRTSVKLDASKS